MRTILFILLLSSSAHSANFCELAGRCYICHKCELNHSKCVKKADKNAYDVNTCDFIQYTCKIANKCNVEIDVKPEPKESEEE